MAEETQVREASEMILHVTREVPVPNGATHYSGDLLDGPEFFKVTQVGVAGDHWWRWDPERVTWVFTSHARPAWIEPLPTVVPSPDEREDGLEVLAFHRGKWRHVRWVAEQKRWILGYGGEFIEDAGRAFAPLPQKPEGADGFYDWRG